MSPYDPERGSDSLTPEEWAAERLAALRSAVYPTARLGDITPPEPLVDGWLYAHELSWIFGKRSHMKSFVALDMAGCVGTGLDWHGYPTKQATVVYAALEGASGQHRRVQAWEDRYGVPMANVHFLAPRSLHIITDAEPLADLVAGLGAGLLILDTQNRAATGLEENSSVDMGRMIAHMGRVAARTGAGLLTVHHTSDGYRPRGHTSIDGAAQSMIRVARDGTLVKVSNDKQKDGPTGRPLVLVARPRLDSLVLEPEAGVPAVTDTGKQIIRSLTNLVALRGEATYTELKRACTGQGMNEDTFNWSLRRLVQQAGVVKGKGRYGTYTLPPPGERTQGELEPQGDE